MADVSAARIANASYNPRNAGVKRILREAREIAEANDSDFHAAPLEDNLFEWHFTIRGPPETDFAGGIYHGRIMLPKEYPMRPPNMILLTPNGRFELNKKICLTITGYHEDQWQPVWGIRTAIMALTSFFPQQMQHVGGMEAPSKDRKRFALQSTDWKCPHCNVCNKDILPAPTSTGSTTTETEPTTEESPVAATTVQAPPTITTSAPPGSLSVETSPAIMTPHLIPPARSPTTEATLTFPAPPSPAAAAAPPRPGPRPPMRAPAHLGTGAASAIVGVPVEAFEGENDGENENENENEEQEQEQEQEQYVETDADADYEDRLARGAMGQEVVVRPPATQKIDALIGVLVFVIAALILRKLTPGELKAEV